MSSTQGVRAIGIQIPQAHMLDQADMINKQVAFGLCVMGERVKRTFGSMDPVLGNLDQWLGPVFVSKKRKEKLLELADVKSAGPVGVSLVQLGLRPAQIYTILFAWEAHWDQVAKHQTENEFASFAIGGDDSESMRVLCDLVVGEGVDQQTARSLSLWLLACLDKGAWKVNGYEVKALVAPGTNVEAQTSSTLVWKITERKKEEEARDMPEQFYELMDPNGPGQRVYFEPKFIKIPSADGVDGKDGAGKSLSLSERVWDYASAPFYAVWVVAKMCALGAFVLTLMAADKISYGWEWCQWRLEQVGKKRIDPITTRNSQ